MRRGAHGQPNPEAVVTPHMGQALAYSPLTDETLKHPADMAISITLIDTKQDNRTEQD